VRAGALISPALGISVGIALHVYGRSGNGFLVGPGMFASVGALVVSVAGAGLLILLRKWREAALSIILFSLTALATLVLLSWLRPPPPAGGTVPLTEADSGSSTEAGLPTVRIRSSQSDQPHSAAGPC
jgi:hypothetical protein